MVFFKSLLTVFVFLSILGSNFSFAAVEYPEGLGYEVRKLDDVLLDKVITKNYDLYEFYLENNSVRTFSVPGYSIDLGVEYSGLAEVESLFKNKSKKKSFVFNLATGAAAIALGGIARTAASTVRSVSGFGKNKNTFDEHTSFLSPNKTYILYPGDGLSLFLFVDKKLSQAPNTVRFICRDEETNSTQIVINDRFKFVTGKIESASTEPKSAENNEILAAPAEEHYK